MNQAKHRNKRGLHTPAIAGAGVLALLLAIGSCGEGAGSEDLLSIDSPLSSTDEQCGTATAAATITGSGFHTSPADYNPASCYRGYLLDVNSYRPGEKGMLVAYSGPAPATEEECLRTSLRTYVWRKNTSGAPTYLANPIRKGQWVNDGFGGKRCATPHVDLSVYFTPAQLPRGGNFRLAMRASILPPAGSSVAEVYKKIYVSIPQGGVGPSTPGALISNAAVLAASYTSGAPIQPQTQALWDLRKAPAAVRGPLCRSWDIRITAMRANALTLKKLVPASEAATVDSLATTANSIRTLICNTDPYPDLMRATLQSIMGTHMGLPQKIQLQVAQYLGVGLLEAADIMSFSGNLDFQRLMTRCGAKNSEIKNFVVLGTTPAGMVGMNPLLRNCSGSSVTSIASGAGIGFLTPGDARGKYQACVAQQTAALAPQCQGPRANDPVNANPADSPSQYDGPCQQGETQDLDTKTCYPPGAQPPTGEEATDLERIRTYVSLMEDYEESERRSQSLATQQKIETYFGTGLTILGATPGLQGLIYVGLAVLGEALVSDLANDQLKIQQKNIKQAMCALNPQDVQVCGSGNRCPEFDLLGDKAWMQTAPSPLNPDGVANTQSDRIEDCACQLFDKDYRKTSGFEFGGPSPFCPDARAQLNEDCLRNPETIGPTGKVTPRPECIAILYPKDVDRVSMAARWCHAKMPNCTGAYLDDQGACACPGGGGGFPAEGNPSCPGGATATNCGPDGYFDEKNCVCVLYDSGLGCAKGGLSGYLAKRLSDVHLATFPNEAATIRGKNFLMFASGNTPVATRSIQSSGLTSAMTQIKLSTRLPVTTLQSGYQGWAVQLSCTNAGNNVQNRNLGTKQLQALTPGANTLTYALTAADRTACFNNDQSPVRFEIRSNNQAGQPRIGFEDFSVTNLIDDLPNLPDPCSPPTPPGGPDPSPIALPPRLTFDGLYKVPSWIFSEGTVVTFPVIR